MGRVNTMSRNPSLIFASALLSGVLLLPQSAFAQSAQCAAPDNSKHNTTDAVTADSQSNATADRKATQQIRKAIIADKDLSLYAHNCKIIAHGGTVVLKGPVRSDEEKQKVGELAASVVGADHITNALTVKAN